MSFNSFQLILIFLPAALVLFYLGGRIHRSLPLVVVLLASLIFYGSWGIGYALLLVGSVAVNFFLGRGIEPKRGLGLLVLGVCFNLGLIAYFKYADFIIANGNRIFGTHAKALSLVLPLGISFYAFQQIAFLVDRRRGVVKAVAPLDYVPFVVFFPQLISGPIVRFAETGPQWARIRSGVLGSVGRNLVIGLFVFAIGLFKKVAIADVFADAATPIFAAPESANSLIAWKAALSFTLQIYFDFSGLVDMAIGAARMFGVTLPQNFDSPYKATSIIDFWRRWHVTLSMFLRDYLYIPLGGNRHGFARQMANLMVTMLLGGLWHGASWTFVVWGGLHGGFLIVNHSVKRLMPWLKLGRVPSIALTFLAVLVAWVPFRAESFETTWLLWKRMADLPAVFSQAFTALQSLTSAQLHDSANWAYDQLGLVWCLMAVGSLVAVWGFRNVTQLAQRIDDHLGSNDEGKWDTMRWMCCAGVMLGISLMIMNSGRISKFLYAQF